MRVTVLGAARALAVGFTLAAAGSAPAWSQSLIGDGLPANAGQYYGSAPAPYGYQQPYAYAPEAGQPHRHHHHR